MVQQTEQIAQGQQTTKQQTTQANTPAATEPSQPSQPKASPTYTAALDVLKSKTSEEHTHTQDSHTVKASNSNDTQPAHYLYNQHHHSTHQSIFSPDNRPDRNTHQYTLYLIHLHEDHKTINITSKHHKAQMIHSYKTCHQRQHNSPWHVAPHQHQHHIRCLKHSNKSSTIHTTIRTQHYTDSWTGSTSMADGRASSNEWPRQRRIRKKQVWI